MLEDDWVCGVEYAGLGEEGVGLGVVAEHALAAGLLDELGDAVLAGEGKGEGIVVVVGVELDGSGKVGGCVGGVVAVELVGSGEVCVFGLALLAGGDGGSPRRARRRLRRDGIRWE